LERGRAYDAAESAAESAAAEAELQRFKKQRAASFVSRFRVPKSNSRQLRIFYSEFGVQHSRGLLRRRHKLEDARWLAENFPRPPPYEK
jgi:hypothetical protein